MTPGHPKGGRRGHRRRAKNRSGFALADAIDSRYRVLVLLAVFAPLRWGEVAALRRCDIDLAGHTVRVERQLTELGGGFAYAPPKSDAGQRLVVFPEVITGDLAAHLAAFVAPGDDALAFTNRTGGPLRHGNVRRRV